MSETTPARAQPGHMELHEPKRFATHVWYTTSDKPQAVEAADYFHSCRDILKAGDEILVACIADDGAWAKARFEVAYADEAGVLVERLEDWRSGGGKRPKLKLRAEYAEFGKWDVFHEAGRLYKRGVPKEEAERLVGHALGKKPKAA